MTEELDGLQSDMLTLLYLARFREGDGTYNLNAWAEEKAVDRDLVWRAYDELNDADLLQLYAAGGRAELTSAGILHVEQNGLVDSELISHHRSVRTRILDVLMTFYEERGRYRTVDMDDVVARSETSKEDFDRNIDFLTDAGTVSWEAMRSPMITSDGRSLVLDYRKRRDRIQGYEELSRLEGVTPQQRGHRLEDLLTEAIADSGWETDKRVRSQGQEHDLIIHLGVDYYFLSCKWESDPIQPKEVELLESRVRSRADSRGGILISISGFTENCIEEARFKISSAVVLLFGKDDVELVLSGQRSFTDILNDKLESAMHHRKLLIDGEEK